jgi:alpha-D-ribose 1-methylphosphonate 5-triphosphate synthase subunit PhnH
MQDELTAQMQDAEAGKGAQDVEDNINAQDRGDEVDDQGGDDTGAPADGDKKEPDAQQADDSAATDDDAGAPGIPRSRFNVINERRKEAETRAANLEARLQQLEQQQAAAPAQPADTPAQPDANETLIKHELAEATKAYTQAVADQDTDAAVEAQMKMTEAQSKLFAAKMPQVEKAPDMAEAVEEVNYNNALKELKVAYPQLDEESKHYDETAVIEVNELYGGLLAAGKPKATAISRAVEYVLPGVKNRTPNRADTERNIQNAQDAAPDLTNRGEVGAGDPYKGVKVENLSDDDFDKLPDSKKAELRGDFL